MKLVPVPVNVVAPLVLATVPVRATVELAPKLVCGVGHTPGRDVVTETVTLAGVKEDVAVSGGRSWAPRCILESHDDRIAWEGAARHDDVVYVDVRKSLEGRLDVPGRRGAREGPGRLTVEGERKCARSRRSRHGQRLALVGAGIRGGRRLRDVEVERVVASSACGPLAQVLDVHSWRTR